MKRFRVPLVAALVTVLFLSLAALATGKPGQPPGKPASPGKSAAAKSGSAAAQYQYGKVKVQICHKGKTIRIAQPAVRAHLRHGDSLGPCP